MIRDKRLADAYLRDVLPAPEQWRKVTWASIDALIRVGGREICARVTQDDLPPGWEMYYLPDTGVIRLCETDDDGLPARHVDVRSWSAVEWDEI